MAVKLLRSALVASIGMTLLSLAALLYGVGRVPAGPALRFDPDPFVIAEPMRPFAYSEHPVDVVNDGDEPARIVGVEEFCSSACYYGQGLPVSIPSQGRAKVNIRIKANAPGPISDAVDFFTDRPDQPRLTLKIVGRIREAAPDDPTSYPLDP